MSYDIYLKENVCDHCERGDDAGLDWNYTSNMAPAWRSAGADLAEFHGKRAEECAPILRVAIERMEAEFHAYETQFNSPNGWGSMATLVPALTRLLRALEEHPGATVRVSR